MHEASQNMTPDARFLSGDSLSAKLKVLKGRLRSSGFERLPDPVFLIGRSGMVVDANYEAKRLISRLPAQGNRGAIGRKELAEIFVRAGSHDFAPMPLRVETTEGARHYEARFAPSSRSGTKAVVFADVTIWKKALAEKDAALHFVRREAERPIAVCARCGSLKHAQGEWGKAGELAQASIPENRLSHGLCPQCLNEELGNLGLSTQEAQRISSQSGRS